MCSHECYTYSYIEEAYIGKKVKRKKEKKRLKKQGVCDQWESWTVTRHFKPPLPMRCGYQHQTLCCQTQAKPLASNRAKKFLHPSTLHEESVYVLMPCRSTSLGCIADIGLTSPNTPLHRIPPRPLPASIYISPLPGQTSLTPAPSGTTIHCFTKTDCIPN